MSNSRSPTQEEVYLAFRGVFKGLASEIRRTPAIERHLRCHFNKAIKAFFANYDPDSTNQVIKLLLEEGIFASEARARLRFPSLFQTSAAVVPTPSSPKSMVVQVQQSVGNMEKTTPEVAAPVIKAIPVVATVPEIVPTAPVVTPSSIAKPQSPVTSNASVLSPEVVIPVIQDSAPEHQAPEFVQSSQDGNPFLSPRPLSSTPISSLNQVLLTIQSCRYSQCFRSTTQSSIVRRAISHACTVPPLQSSTLSPGQGSTHVGAGLLRVHAKDHAGYSGERTLGLC